VDVIAAPLNVYDPFVEEIGLHVIRKAGETDGKVPRAAVVFTEALALIVG